MKYVIWFIIELLIVFFDYLMVHTIRGTVFIVPVIVLSKLVWKEISDWRNEYE